VLLWATLEMSRRFRRTVNIPLAAATALAAVAAQGIIPAAASIGTMQQVHEELTDRTTSVDELSEAVDYFGERELINRLTSYCQSSCGVTVSQVAARPAPTKNTTNTNDSVLIAKAREVTELSSDATRDYGVRTWAVVCLALAAALVPAGLRSRIDEFRSSR
jgi:hypothetical protein